ncbi:MAG: ABC transporter substrate-binding protein, partial [Phycisphaeraceae bacterium]
MHASSEPTFKPIRLVLLCGALLLLVACGDQAGSSASNDTPPTEPQTGGTLTLAIQSDGRTLDPRDATDAGSRRLIENLYSTLMRYSEDFPDVEPDLLAEHEVSEDFRTFDFKLKEDVTFHSGRPLTAEDVRFSLQRLKDSGASEPLSHLSNIEVHDDLNLTLHFAEPMSPLLTYLANPQYGIVDREVVEANDGDITRIDAGSGPFRLVRWQRNQQCVLERFEDYHEPDRPRLDRLVYQPIQDRTARTVALINGQVDLVVDVPLLAVERVEASSG